jgi:hypothetical protein
MRQIRMKEWNCSRLYRARKNGGFSQVP